MLSLILQRPKGSRKRLYTALPAAVWEQGTVLGSVEGVTVEGKLQSARWSLQIAGDADLAWDQLFRCSCPNCLVCRDIHSLALGATAVAREMPCGNV